MLSLSLIHLLLLLHDSSHPLALRIREKERMGIELTEIRIGNLSLDSVKSLVAEALGMEGDEDRVDALATTVHKKTEGNAFFVVLFLRSMYDEQLLRYNFGLESWVWDDAVVESKLVTENVATILSSKLKRLTQSSQSIIKIASWYVAPCINPFLGCPFLY